MRWQYGALAAAVIFGAISARAQAGNPDSPQGSSQTGTPAGSQAGTPVSGQAGTPVSGQVGTSVSGQSGMHGSATTGGHTSTQFRECALRDVSLAGMSQCASDEAAKADSELDEAYKTLRLKAKLLPGAMEKAEEVENAWTRYRDAYMDATFPAADKQGVYGSVYPMNRNLLRAALTRDQTARLKELARRYNEEAR